MGFDEQQLDGGDKMTRLRVRCCALLAISLTGAATALADTNVSVGDVPVTLGWSGFVRADYGNGDRYPVADGEDRLGSTKDFLVLSATTEDIQAILDFGGTALSQSQGGSDIGIKDAFIVIGAGQITGFSLSAGAQPLLFGLKPNGYPGDSSLTPNIDYGNNGAFAVSQQAGPAVILNYNFTADLSIRVGAFDLVESNTGNIFTATNGSKIGDNQFILLRGNNLGGTGLYATAGGERIYVGLPGGPLGTQGGGPVGGVMVDHSKAIYSAGVGWKQDIFDISAEYIHLNAAIVNTQGDERYIRAYASVQPVTDWTVYADYSNAHEIGVNDYRGGVIWQFRRHLSLTAEYSRDNYNSTNELFNGAASIVTGTAVYGTTRPPNVQSVDLRLTFQF
jgi:hypothetical protein